MISRNPVTGAEYEMPASSDDRAGIDAFLARHPGKPVVVVQGLGFVGAVMALVCANALSAEYAVIGVDLFSQDSWWRVQSLRDGVFPLTAADPKIPEFHGRAVAQGNFYATTDPYAYSRADVVVVDVNLDVQKRSAESFALDGFAVDLRGFRAAISTIGAHCRPDVLVLVETTVPPGTCEHVVLPVLREALQGRGLPLHQLRVGHSYERVMPGPTYIDSIRTFPRVYSGTDAASADAAEAFLRTIIDTERCPLTRLHSTTATEMAKVLENSYRAMNIAFMVEWSRFAEEAGVDIYAVVNAIRQRPTHANLMFPGIGVGGYCLTKDPLLASWARQHLLGGTAPLSVSEGAVSINDQMPRFAFEYLERRIGSLRDKRTLLLGVSYRGDVGDTRSTPVDGFLTRLEQVGATVDLHDPFVPIWVERDRAVGDDLSAALAHAPEVIVLSAGHSVYRTDESLAQLLAAPPAVLFDPIGFFGEAQLTRLRERHRVIVLGRGDL
jgi:nucleotide sugar dehydrogenase